MRRPKGWMEVWIRSPPSEPGKAWGAGSRCASDPTPQVVGVPGLVSAERFRTTALALPPARSWEASSNACWRHAARGNGGESALGTQFRPA